MRHLGNKLVAQRHAVRHRRVRLHQDAVCLAERDKLGGRIADMRQHLVDLRLHRCVIHNVAQVVLVEVGNANHAHLASRLCFLKRAPCSQVAFLVTIVGLVDLRPRLRAVDDHLIHVIQAQLRKRLVNRSLRRLVILQLGCNLRRHEQLPTVNAAGAHAFANAGFVAIRLRRINHSVTDFHRIAHRLSGLGIVHQPRAQSDFGHRYAAFHDKTFVKRFELLRHACSFLLVLIW